MYIVCIIHNSADSLPPIWNTKTTNKMPSPWQRLDKRALYSAPPLVPPACRICLCVHCHRLMRDRFHAAQLFHTKREKIRNNTLEYRQTVWIKVLETIQRLMSFPRKKEKGPTPTPKPTWYLPSRMICFSCISLECPTCSMAIISK